MPQGLVLGSVARYGIVAVSAFASIIGESAIGAETNWNGNGSAYTSRLGRCVLEIQEVNHADGADRMYRVVRDAKQPWSQKHPFALSNAAVTDMGSVVGYGYNAAGVRECGDFLVVIIDGTGRIRRKEVIKHQGGGPFDHPPSPSGLEVAVDELSDRAIVQVDGIRPRWWIYRLSTGATIAKIDPADFMPRKGRFHTLDRMVPVPGTELNLAHWSREDDRPAALFTLVGVEGRPVWSLELPAEWKEGKSRESTFGRIRRRSAILRTGNRQFELWCDAESERVAFEIGARLDGKYTVTEVSRVRQARRKP